jgi:TM2 domain-containing membrane protein YozV
MRENIKAALLSALVLPGVGQIYRGRKLKGGILVLLVTILLLAVAILLVAALREFIHAMRLSGDMDSTLAAGLLRSWAPAGLWLGGAFFCLWVYGVADALLDRGERKDPGAEEKPAEGPGAR